jgi:hypothetical protein
MSRLAVMCVVGSAVWVLAGCASFEPHPHPYVSHDKLPFTEGPLPPGRTSLEGARRTAVCDVESQAVTPVGAYLVGRYLERLTELNPDEAGMSDIICNELSECGAPSARLRGDGHPLLLEDQVRRDHDLLLKGTVLCLEYSQHGLKESPYDFLYVAIRYTLVSLRDGATVWRGDVAAYRKTAPAPGSDQKTMVSEALRLTVRSLAADRSFGAALTQTGRQP